MPKDFIPRSDADLLLWAQANSAVITATPTAFGLTAAIATTYSGLVSTFDAKLTAARAENRGRVNIIEKDTAREALIAYARAWARLAQGQLTLTTAQRAALGLNLRDNHGRPINPPQTPPVVTVTQAIGRTFKLTVRAAGSDGRAKPAGAQGVTVFTFLGTEASSNPSDWTCQGQSTRGNFDLELESSVPAGAKIWISAVWYSPRGLYSTMSNPISAYVAGGVASSETLGQASTEVPALKAA